MNNEYHISSIVLAAGKSIRAGGSQKLLFKKNGLTIIEKTVRSLVDSKVDEVILVLGFEADLILKIFSNYNNKKLKIIINTGYNNGMSSSIITGLEKIHINSTAAMICLGDQPFIDSELINLLIDCYNSSNKGIVVPLSSKGEKGHPVIFSSKYFGILKTLRGDSGGRKIIAGNLKDIFFFKTDHDSVTTDIDTLTDFAKYNDL
jgi:molybdenum cofactor cytidylyltransferase